MPGHLTTPAAVRFVPYARGRGGARRAVPATDGALALSREPVPAGSPPGRRPRPPNPLRLVRPDEHPDESLDAVALGTVRLVLEVIAGVRTPHHLSHRATPQVCRGLAEHHRPLAAGTRYVPPRVLTTWLQEPAPGRAETGAVALLNGRVHALAMRLERVRGRWRCTTLETTAPV